MRPLSSIRPAVFDLSTRTRLVFSGADRLRYLNGQLTQDLKKLQAGQALPACVTTAKGRLQAEVWVTLDDGEAISVDAAPELQEILAARLERYIVADDVTLEDCTGKQGLLHCVGFSPVEHPVLNGFPASRAARLGVEGWDVLVSLDRLQEVKDALGAQLSGSADWERLRIENGVPAWGAELGDDTLPPEAGLDETHIDYHKGCYIGQEVISRIKSVGHVNRSLCTFTGEAERLPSVGGAILSEAGTEVGVLTSVSRTEATHFAALGYLRRGQAAERFFTGGGIALSRGVRP